MARELRDRCARMADILGSIQLELGGPSVLREFPLEKLSFSPEMLKGDSQFLRDHATLEFIGVEAPLYAAKMTPQEF